MIYITGDTHADFRRFSTSKFPAQKQMTKDDLLIICGDFGGIWSDTPEERHWLDWFNNKPFTTLFVDGNHENFDRLYSGEFKEIDYCGGRAHKIRDSIFHLMRGYAFELQGKKFFCFGGASSHDVRDGILDPADFKSHRSFRKEYWRRFILGEQFRVKGYSWWPQELPSEEEMKRGTETLEENRWSVDYVITHCLPQEVASVFSTGKYDPDSLTMYFNLLLQHGLRFNHWYCGHYHTNARVMGKFDILYDRIIRIE